MKSTLTAVALTSTLLVLGVAGCRGDPAAAPVPTPSSTSTDRPGATTASSPQTPRVVAALKLRPASSLVATPHWLWVLGGPSGVLTQIDPRANTVVRTVRPPHPPGFGTFAHGSLWVASLDDDAVMQLDADSGRLERTLVSARGTPFFRPIGIAATGRSLWVVNHGDDTTRSTLTRLDARTGAVTGTASLPGHHAGSPIVMDGHVWVAMTTEGTVARVDARTGHLDGAPVVVDTGTCLAASAAAGSLWFTGLDDHEGGTCRDAARRLTPETARVSATVYGPGLSLYDFAVAAGSTWASDVGHTIYSVDVDSGVVRPRLALQGPDATNRMIAAFGSLWVLGGETGRLVRLDVN